MSSETRTMLFDLRAADVRAKWLVTCLLATFGLAYGFGGVMVALYAGFTPARVAATYSAPQMAMPMPPDTSMVTLRAMTMADFAKPEIHTVDRDLLIQDTHVHVPMYGIIAAVLSVIVLGAGLTPRAGIALITLVFAAPWFDFAGMWLTMYLSPRFAVVTVIGGWAMGLGYLLVTAIAIRRMWFIQKGVPA